MRLGTRASALALAQARWVARRLGEAGQPVEIVEITTLGDRGAAVQDKSRWVSELERALLDGRIDLAVHSAKDLPTELDAGLELVAVPAREDPRDAICGAPGLDALSPGARIGTASLRRAAQIRAARADLQVVELRGNVDTRLRKLAAGEVDALVLALAGLRRLGRAGEAAAPIDAFVPAAGQGALALEGRVGELNGAGSLNRARAGELDAALGVVLEEHAMACVTAERTLVHALGASCHTPVGAHARRLDDGRLALAGWVGLPDGSAWLRDEVTGDPSEVGALCAQRMLAAGAAELLARAEDEGAA